MNDFNKWRETINNHFNQPEPNHQAISDLHFRHGLSFHSISVKYRDCRGCNNYLNEEAVAHICQKP